MPTVYLASTSPRRRTLLEEAGVDFAVIPPGPELPGHGSPLERARHRARGKAVGARAPAPDALVLAVDTVVDLEGRELGKPADRAGARGMLSRLAGRDHRVHTAHCLWRRSDRRSVEAVTHALVRCGPLTEEDVEAYLDLGTWRGKAGAYGIQDRGASFLEVVEGDPDTVIGLSMAAVHEILSTMRDTGV